MKRREFFVSSIDAIVFFSPRSQPLKKTSTLFPLFSSTQTQKNKTSSARRPLLQGPRHGTTSSPTRSPPRPRGSSGRSSRGWTPPPLLLPKTTTTALQPLLAPPLPPLARALRAPPPPPRPTLPCSITPVAPALARAGKIRWASESSTHGRCRCCRCPRTLPLGAKERRRGRSEVPPRRREGRKPSGPPSR